MGETMMKIGAITFVMKVATPILKEGTGSGWGLIREYRFVYGASICEYIYSKEERMEGRTEVDGGKLIASLLFGGCWCMAL